jgi:hypothetical protein
MGANRLKNRLLILALALPTVAAAQAPQRFNLNCTIKERFVMSDNKLTNSELSPDGIDAPFVLRVDLVAKQYVWCLGDRCGAIEKVDADANSLTLHETNRTILVPIQFTVSRRTGAFIQSGYMVREGGPIMTVDGSCKPAPFTPLPKALF